MNRANKLYKSVTSLRSELQVLRQAGMRYEHIAQRYSTPTVKINRAMVWLILEKEHEPKDIHIRAAFARKDMAGGYAIYPAHYWPRRSMARNNRKVKTMEN